MQKTYSVLLAAIASFIGLLITCGLNAKGFPTHRPATPPQVVQPQHPDPGDLPALVAANRSAYLKASNTDANDFFGYSVAISGDTMVVGAVGEMSNATGVNGNQGNHLPFVGAAYVFVRSGASWSQQAYLKASNSDHDDRFGFSVSISGDTIVVGADGEDSKASGVNGNQSDNSLLDSGGAYVFVRSGTSWSQQAYLKASNPDARAYFGNSVSISGDRVVVGAPHVASGAGAAYVFVRSATSWIQQAYLKASNTDASDDFGRSVSISGDTVVVGADGEDSNATGVNGNQGSNSASMAGAAYVFVFSGANWKQQAYLKASNTQVGDGFGSTVAISGDTVVVGAIWEDSWATGVNGNQGDNRADAAGAAYVFVRNGTSWSQQAYLKASDTFCFDNFGGSVSISSDTVVVGAPHQGFRVGAAYVFVRTGASWGQRTYLKASNANGGDFFGGSISISSDTVVVGARWEASKATGVNGNQSDNSAYAAGAAYVFHSDNSWDNWAKSTVVGSGCVARGQPPALTGTPPVLGSSTQIFIGGAPQSNPGVNILGVPHPGIGFGPVCTIYVDLGLPIIPLYFTTDGVGLWKSTLVPVGLSPSLIGVSLGLQAGIAHPTPPFGLALTNGLVLTIGY